MYHLTKSNFLDSVNSGCDFQSYNPGDRRWDESSKRYLQEKKEMIHCLLSFPCLDNLFLVLLRTLGLNNDHLFTLFARENKRNQADKGAHEKGSFIPSI